jgi:peptidoglycan/xylan/chitin deacetylase (PgdA/CDA1 family)
VNASAAPAGVVPEFGALVVSLDFELHWGVRDWAPPDGPYLTNLLGAREAIPRMLELFEEFDVAATWATVGLLFARSKEEADRFRPTVLPRYRNPSLRPYGEPVGTDESDDPLHFGRSLVDAIRRTPRQEVASHTFSHYYCREPGQDTATFAADVASAVAIARAAGVDVRSMVFPRNQVDPRYVAVLGEHGFVSYRGRQLGWINWSHRMEGFGLPARVTRVLDAYVNISGSSTGRWDRMVDGAGLCNIPATRFLRPYVPRLRHLEPLRLHRIRRIMTRAASSKRVCHLWWHPHNFGAHTDENLAALRTLLEHFSTLRRTHGMRSMTMSEVAATLGVATPPLGKPEAPTAR